MLDRELGPQCFGGQGLSLNLSGWRFLPSRGTSTAEKVNKNVQNLESNLPFSKDNLEFMQGSTSALGDVHS